jgi:hypothetical protein
MIRVTKRKTKSERAARVEVILKTLNEMYPSSV